MGVYIKLQSGTKVADRLKTNLLSSNAICPPNMGGAVHSWLMHPSPDRSSGFGSSPGRGTLKNWFMINVRISSYDARGKFGGNRKRVRVAQGDSR